MATGAQNAPSFKDKVKAEVEEAKTKLEEAKTKVQSKVKHKRDKAETAPTQKS